MRSKSFTLSFLVVLASGVANAAAVTFDFTAQGTFNAPSLVLGPLTVTADDGVNPANVNLFNLNGLGVIGGFASNTIDGNEGVLFSFTNGPASGVRYAVTSSGNLNGNGTAGDAFLEAFDGNGVSLGTIAVSASTNLDLTVLFGPTPISKFRVRANVDNHRIGTVSYNNPVAGKTADFTNLGTFTSSTLASQGLTITADDGTNPALVNVLNLNGLGVVGGLSNLTVDSAEALTYDFGGAVRQQVSYFVSTAGNQNGNGLVGESTVEAWNENGVSLGVVATDNTGNHSVSAMFGGALITKFRVRAQVDNHRVAQVTSNPATGVIVALDAIPSVVTNRLAIGGLIAHAQRSGLSVQLAATLGLGLGVAGGTSSTTIDGSEEATFFFDDKTAGSAEFRVDAATDANGNGFLGNAFVEAYDQNGLSQGTLAISGIGTKDIGALFPGPLFSGFTVRADIDGLTIGRIQYTPQPGLFSFPHYGTGCPGTGGITPRTRVTALAPDGGASVTLKIAQGLPGASAFLFLGLARTELPMGFGCRFFLTPALGPYGPFTLTPGGDFALTTTIPSLPIATTATVQALIADGGVPAAFSATNGVEVNLQP